MNIAVCTSTPHSAQNVKKTFESIYAQTMRPDKIIWNYPLKSNQEYPPIPSWISEFGDVLEVNICEDHGKSTKIIPILPMHNVSTIILFDDNTIYDQRCIETLLLAHRENAACAVGFLGHTYKLLPFKYKAAASWVHSTRPTIHNEVATIASKGMVLYPRIAFPLTSEEFIEHLETNTIYAQNDDLLYGTFARRNGISIHVIHLANNVTYTTKHGSGRTAWYTTLKYEGNMVYNGDLSCTFFGTDIIVLLLIFSLITCVIFAR
jgi:hypothetical protein